ncbi:MULTISPECIES: hypothetical protein [Thiorhodovibrio]|uniref:hypothetical protein n=1 Tax=Thiorhodovibrio TaxID=61593 RepID=UPI0019144E78|nr:MULTISPECIES: hypothetical protein [Thiorhodovibrio]MBK5969176.1 hypothetical protein [Thiorhodovibrio winogradskyi]WPL11165.1 hypothetical protein Thiosp_00893 [Thiorhodovibrio litoralis]
MMLQQVVSQASSVPPFAAPEDAHPPTLAAGFLPAFRHELDGEVRLCLTDDGRLSSVHLLDSLPAEWVAERDDHGRVMALVEQVSAGYLRGHEFWSLGELRRPRLDS